MHEKLSREHVVAKTIELMNETVPKITNKSAVHQIMKAKFSRTSPDLYEMFDAFFYCIINGVTSVMEERGIKQPAANDFLESFRIMQGISLNIGNLRIENSIPTEEFRDSVIKDVIEKLTDKYNIPIVDVEGKIKNVPVDPDKELEETFDKYEGIFEEEDEDVISEGENSGNGK